MKTNIAVIFGGRSTEHEISVISANQAMHAIDTNKYEVTPIYISKDGRMYTGAALLDIKEYKNIPSLIKKCDEIYFRPEYGNHNIYTTKKSFLGSKTEVLKTIDVVIPVLHGANSEDGSIQGLLVTTGLPFAGCDVMASANGMDKISMKMILRSQNIPVVDFEWFTDKQWNRNKSEIIERLENSLGYPMIIKPSNLGSSVGIGKAADRNELVEKIDEAQKYSRRIIVEKLISELQEINCSVLGDADDYKMSVLEEPIKTGDFLSYEDKYMGGGKGAKGMQASQKKIPADLDEKTTKRIQFLAGETFRVLDCQGVSRVDVILDKATGEIYVNEINTIPGSLSFYLWEATGLSFSGLMDELIKLALKRNREAGHKILSFDQNIFALGGGTKGAKGVK